MLICYAVCSYHSIDHQLLLLAVTREAADFGLLLANHSDLKPQQTCRAEL